ncbi:hypothetical protein VC83_04043 [Pseudogymnoascus destructans]|uniref:Uncharacterized protein n=1 Tax=Pseudogymnoascus destructans TaxID=655981 RepID=A0A177AEA7_9PEZI|nr:uncharacterized protein VC83_04043 [Pseudogymnoascus destructans]OAF59752.1 hypothetical protein VC83_04043 [Pseudogymnoascus destructans]
MSDLITGKHLEPENLDGQNITGELERFGQWAKAVKFQPLSPGIEKCEVQDRDQKVRLVLKELGYENKLEIKYQILFARIHRLWHCELSLRASAALIKHPLHQVREELSILMRIGRYLEGAPQFFLHSCPTRPWRPVLLGISSILIDDDHNSEWEDAGVEDDLELELMLRRDDILNDKAVLLDELSDEDITSIYALLTQAHIDAHKESNFRKWQHF